MDKDSGEKPGVEVGDGENSLEDEARGLAHGEGGGSIEDQMKEGKAVLLYGPDPREDVGKLWTSGIGMVELTDVVEGWDEDGERMVNEVDELGWWTTWSVREGGKKRGREGAGG